MLSQRLFFSEPSIANNYQYQYRSNTIPSSSSGSNSKVESTKPPTVESSAVVAAGDAAAAVAAAATGVSTDVASGSSVNEQRIHLTSSTESKSPSGPSGQQNDKAGSRATSPSLSSSIRRQPNGTAGTTTNTTSTSTATTTAAASTIPSSPKISPVKYIEELFLKSPGGPAYLTQVKDQLKQRVTFPKPSKEDIDVYDVDIVRAIRMGDIPALHSILQTKGPQVFNGCNRFGESLLHMACRRGNLDVVHFLLQTARVTIERYDDYGRTPLHDACWTSQPNIPIVQLLISKCTPALLLSRDIRGHTPFHYARAEHHPTWEAFLQSNETLLLLRISLYMSTLSSLPATVTTIAPPLPPTSAPVSSITPSSVSKPVVTTGADHSKNVGTNIKSLTSASLLTSTTTPPVVSNIVTKANPPPAGGSSLSTSTSVCSSIAPTEIKPSSTQTSVQQHQQLPVHLQQQLQQQQLSMSSPSAQRATMIAASNMSLQNQPAQIQQQQQSVEYQQAQQLRMQQYIQLHFQQMQNQLQQQQFAQTIHPGGLILNQNQMQSLVAVPQVSIMAQQQTQSMEPSTRMSSQQQPPAKVGGLGPVYMKSMSVSENGVVNFPLGGANGSGTSYGIAQLFPSIGQQQQQQLPQQQQANVQVQMLQQEYLQRQNMFRNANNNNTDSNTTTGASQSAGAETNQSGSPMKLKTESDDV